MASRRKLFNKAILWILMGGAIVFILLLSGVGADLFTNPK